MKCIHRGSAIRPIPICTTEEGKKVKRYYPSYVCSIFNRCLTQLKAFEPQHEESEAKLFHLCHGCDRKELERNPK